MIKKSIQYMIECENYPWDCKNFTDYDEIKRPKQHFEKLGYKLINGKWYCPNCAIAITPNEEK